MALALEMEEADRKGDSETIFRCVKIVSGLTTTACDKAPSVDKDDKLIPDQQKLTQVWRQFLEGKFKASQLRQKRSGRDPYEYEDLGPELVADPLTGRGQCQHTRGYGEGA